VSQRLPGERLDRRGPRHRGLTPVESGEDGSALSADAGAPLVGVLALQGDVLEHVRALEAVGLRVVPVRDAIGLAAVDGLVLPGGESTTIGRLLRLGGLLEPLRVRIREGLPVLATCAGLILLSDEIVDDPDLCRPGGLAVRTRRNAYGPQRDSFDTQVVVHGIAGPPMEVSFIRAPVVEAVLADDVEVLAEVDGRPVVVAQGPLLAMAFHPEVTGDVRLHARFAESVRAGAGR
jgi:pyridoxal 5'-phosphate synthase pdxT subunit